MTRRKSNNELPLRMPTFVSRETGAAACEVSPGTWDKWDQEGRLPPRAPGFPASTPRWLWEAVVRKLGGVVPGVEVGDDNGLTGAGNFRSGPQKKHRQPA